MNYLLLFLEGIITFISPCILPMVPVYVSYFVGTESEAKKPRTLGNAFAFVLGFTLIFTLLGAAAGTVGVFFREHMRIINLICGLLMIIFGLNFMGILRFGFLNRSYRINEGSSDDRITLLSTLVFGCIFGIGWTPCVGPFLSSALMIAANTSHVAKGAAMLFIYSLGLGIPFILSAVLIHQLTGAFNFIKKHYQAVKIISGTLLILIGILMAAGWLNKLLALLTF